MKRGLLLLWFALSGCTMGAFQSARTTPKGTTDVTLGATYVQNEQIAERGRGLPNFPLHLGVRHGFTDRFDAGASMLLGTGLLLDAKYGLLDPQDANALSLRLGLGGMSFFGAISALHVPVSVHASRTFGDFTPYASVGYDAWWVWVNADPPPENPQAAFARRSGTGDGLVQVSVGTEWKLGRTTLIGEYTVLQPVLDDPGDFYAFVRNHQFALGVRF